MDQSIPAGLKIAISHPAIEDRTNKTLNLNVETFSTDSFKFGHSPSIFSVSTIGLDCSLSCVNLESLHTSYCNI